MPKTDIDYSNTIFYKIYCKNPDIKDIYIGHTTNFVQRKHAHKRSCTHETSANYNCKVYNVVREYGGWDNWKMEIIAFRECADHYAARKIEQQYFEEYNATLNSIEPLPKPKVIQPKPIQVKVEKKLLYTEMADASVQRSSKMFTCENCNYSTSRDSQYKRHLSTLKHKETDERLTNASANALPIIEYTCDCGKSYSHRQSLHKHKQKCKKTPEPEETPQPAVDKAAVLATDKLFTLVTELMLQLAAKDKQQEELIQQNKELQNTMKEMIPHLGNNNNINSNNNTTFNVQLYLENECKDALSIQEFVKRIEINMEHLKTIAKDGYVDSVSNILIKALNNMAITERPLHCTDLKRETVYIKNNETWNKSTADEPLMNGLINTIENKHYAVVKHYVQTTPAARELDTPEYNFYAKACVHALGNYEDHDKLNKKIYKKVLPEIKLDKSVI